MYSYVYLVKYFYDLCKATADMLLDRLFKMATLHLEMAFTSHKQC